MSAFFTIHFLLEGTHDDNGRFLWFSVLGMCAYLILAVNVLLVQEDGSLYNDGLDIGDDADTLAGTDGASPKGIKG